MAALMSEQDPAMYAGEGFSATDEIPRAEDVAHNPFLYGRVKAADDDYYPPARRKR